MKKTVILLIVCVFSLSGCSNTSNTVTREEYENVVAEVEDLKSQIESLENSEKNSNEDITDPSTNVENSGAILSDKEELKERVWLRDFSYEYDENNKIFISLYQEGERNFYLNGYGVYEEGNLALLQYDRFNLCSFINLLAGEGDSIDMIFTVGEDEYLLIYLEGELISDTVPMDDANVTYPPDKYRDKRDALKKFMDFIHNEQ